MPWGFLIGALVGSLIIAYVFQPKMKIINRQPADIDDFRIPTADEGREIPVIFGTKDIKNANVVWYGNLKTEAIRVKVRSSSLFRSSKRQTVGFKYFLGMHLILCHGPVNAIRRIEAGELPAWVGNVTTNSSIYIEEPDLFGGTDREGGIEGTVSIWMGGPSQGKSTYLQEQLETETQPIPSFRGVVGLVLEQIYITAMSPYIKPWAVRVTRNTITAGGQSIWNSANASIPSGVADSPGMNGSHIIYECLTNPDWGLGYPVSDIDEASFLSAASTLRAELFALSFLWDTETSIESFISMVAEHIDAAVFVDRRTGKFKIKLIRDDYDESILPIFGPNEISEMKGYSRPTVNELVNSIIINYWDVSTGKKGSVGYQELGLLQMQSGVNSNTIEYPGIMNSVTAQRAALRDLKGLAFPLLTSSFECNRLADELEVGSVFKLYWPEYSDEISIMRVTSLEYGDATTDVINVACVEDIFSSPREVVSEPGELDDWIDDREDPEVVTAKRIVEAPYYFIGTVFSFPEINSALSSTPSAGMFSVFAGRSQNALTGRLYMSPTSSGFEFIENMEFVPTGVLSTAVGYLDEYLYFSEYSDLDSAEVGKFGQIGNEIVVINQVGSDFVRVKRGALDTVPVTHDVGARFYAWQEFWASDEEGYSGTTTRHAKVQAVTSIGSSSLSNTSSVSTSMNSRAIRPYPPGYVRINNTPYPTSDVTGTVTVIWRHRNRLSQTGTTIIDTTNSNNFGPEEGTTYRLRILDGGTAIRDVSGIEGTSWDDSEDPIPAGTYTLELRAVRGGYTSWQIHSFPFTRG